ncbi:probable thiopurine S-methyltransferase isoform X3 [Daphnia pulicaria]|nr:probable thiopurine S-methyltransferase isoform X3 [Daphnia pulicaria]
MEERVEYWSKRWQAEDAPWHKTEVNEFLKTYFDHVCKNKEGKLRIFVPLCGKTQDLRWLYDLGHEVVGVDGVEKPILEFFKEQGVTYTKGDEGGLPYYVNDDGRLKIYYCDLFALNPEMCGKFDGIWDRGSLVALLAEDRDKYAKLLKSVLNENFGYLIHTIQYEQSQYPGPPLSVPVEEMKRLFG